MANESLTFSIGADTKSFTDGIGGAIAAIGGLVAAFLGAQSIIQAFSEAINLGGRLNDLSVRTGETAGNLALLERAFENTSVGAEKLGPAIAKMQDNIIAASKEGSTAAQAFERLGLTFDDLLGKSPIQQLELIGVRLSGVADESRRTQIAMDIFGRTGSELIPVLVNMGQELELAKSQLGSLPDQLDRSALSVDSLGDNLAAIGNKATEFAFGILSAIVPLDELTGKLSRLDAAGIGAEFGQALVGAFAAPMKAVGLLGEALVIGAKMMGNELVFQIRSWTEILFNTFSAIGNDIIPILGNSMTGVFGMAVGTFGSALAQVLAPVADMLGLDFIGELAAGSQQLLVDGAAKMAESANAFAVAFEGAKQSSTVVREDLFGAEASSEKIAQDFASLQQSAKSAVTEFNSIFSPTGGSIAEFGGGSVFGETAPTTGLFNETQAQLAMMSAPVTQTFSGGGGTGTQTAAQMQAAINAQLALIAGASSTQAIGRSASAQKVLDLQKEFQTLEALGQGGTPEAIAIQRSIDANKAIALGASLTADELDVARDQAMLDYWRDPTQNFSELEDKYRADFLSDKLKTDPELAQREKAAEAAKQKDAEKPVSMQSLLSAVVDTLGKIEPKIPQHIMS